MELESARRVVIRVLTRSHVSLESPLDPFALATLLGVEVRTMQLPEDGRFEHLGGIPVVSLRNNVSAQRRRFTLTHELIHFIFAASDISMAPETEERLCDRLAAELLAPTIWLRRRYSVRIRNLSTLRHVASDAGISHEAAMIRLREVLRWPETLVTWVRSPAGWTKASMAAAPYELRNKINSAPSTSVALDEARGRTRSDQRIHVPLLVAGACVKVSGHVSVNARSAIALLELRPLIVETTHQVRAPFSSRDGRPRM